jgi:hypothetical protein
MQTKATIEIRMDNAAFQTGQSPQVELRRILLQVCDSLDGSMGPIDFIPLIDINGNRVGEFKANTSRSLGLVSVSDDDQGEDWQGCCHEDQL